MFRKFMDKVAFNRAVALAAKTLRAHSIGPCPFDPDALATMAVSSLWRVRPDVFGGVSCKRPSANTVAMLALDGMVEANSGNPDAQLIMVLAFGHLIQNAAVMGRKGLLPPHEIALYMVAQESYMRATEARRSEQDAILGSLDRVIPGRPVGADAAIPYPVP